MTDPHASSQRLRELAAYWRSWSQRTSIEARANALSACADELDAALASQEPTTDHATAHALLTAWRAEDATLPPEAVPSPGIACPKCRKSTEEPVVACDWCGWTWHLTRACSPVPDALSRAWFEKGWRAALSELEKHGGEWHKWSTPAAAYLAASPPTQEP
jgi:hypothetical protein